MTVDNHQSKKIFNFNVKASQIQIFQNNQILRESLKGNEIQ